MTIVLYHRMAMITSTADLFIVNVTTIVRVLEVAKAEVVDN